MFKEILRKALHFALGFLIIFVGLSINDEHTKRLAMIIAFGFLIFFMILEYFRIEFKVKIPIYHLFIREKENERFNGLVHGLLAFVIIFTFYQYQIALTALTMAVFSDAFAALVGRHLKGPKLFKKKTIIGSSAALIANLIIGIIFLSNIVMILVMAIVATLCELYVDKIDDNLVVPIFTGLAGQLVYLLL